MNVVVDSPITDRLIEIARQRNYRHLADLTHTSHENVRRYLRGLSAPSVEFLSRICAALDINGDWMLTGQGPIRRGDVRAESLARADPGELLSAMASTLERLDSRLQTMERWVQDIETRVRATARSARSTAADATNDHDQQQPRAQRSHEAGPVEVPRRVQRVAQALARRRPETGG